MWECHCDCGGVSFVQGADLGAGKQRSCGCQQTPSGPTAARFTHGEAVHPQQSAEYRIWCGLIKRCENPKDIGWKYYGGRGVTISPVWRHDFPAFLAHVGRRPSKTHSIDRIDPNGHYAPHNVRWATPSEQMHNTREAAAKRSAACP